MLNQTVVCLPILLTQFMIMIQLFDYFSQAQRGSFNFQIPDMCFLQSKVQVVHVLFLDWSIMIRQQPGQLICLSKFSSFNKENLVLSFDFSIAVSEVKTQLGPCWSLLMLIIKFYWLRFLLFNFYMCYQTLDDRSEWKTTWQIGEHVGF